MTPQQIPDHRRGAVWQNYLGDYKTRPTHWFRPRNLDELLQAVHWGARKGLVRAVGSGRSASDVAKPDEVLIDNTALTRELALDAIRENPPGLASDERLFFVEAGITVADLNALLARKVSPETPHGLALSNMSSYDGQTIIGALCTGSHGTGISLGPMSDYVASVVIVTLVDAPGEPGGCTAEVIQVEPMTGVSDPSAFEKTPAKKGWKLTQDDDLFDGVLVSMGCMGVVYALILKTVPMYWLRETRELARWSQVKPVVDEEVHRYRHYDLMINPYPTRQADGSIDHDCLVTKRAPIPLKNETPPGRKLPGRLARELARAFGTNAFTFFLNRFSGIIPRLISGALRNLASPAFTPFESTSANVLSLGIGKDFKAYSTEMAVPASQAVCAIDALIELAARGTEDGFYHTAPFALRFVAPSRGFLSPQRRLDGSPTAMIETPILKGTRGCKQLLRRLETRLYDFGGRPHWGQLNHLHRNAVARMYPELDKWLEVYRRFNRFGVFDNDFSRRVGFCR